MKSSRKLFILVIVAIAVLIGSSRAVFAQVSDREMSALDNAAAHERAHPTATPSSAKEELDLLTLLIKGGIFMLPLALVSVIVVTFVVDRAIGLRISKLLPSRLRKVVINAVRSGELIDPRSIYRECAQSSSAAARIVQTGLVRTGRPQSEIVAAVADATQREADRAYANVRWLSLAAGLGPLLGLLGTVWGLIHSFQSVKTLAPGVSRADYLAGGIYEALVTTLAGLIVAIPAAAAAHFFEGRVSKIFGYIEEIMSDLTRSLERFEGKTRFDVVGRELVARDISSSTHPTILTPPPVAPVHSTPVHGTSIHGTAVIGTEVPKPKITRVTKS